MRKLATILGFSAILAACTGQLPAPQMVEVTRIVEVTRVVEVTPVSTPENLPETDQSSMYFPADCLTRQAGIDYERADWLDMNLMGGCSFIAPSPDGQYIAYSALTCIEPGRCGEAVRIMEAGSQQPVTIQFNQEGKKWVGYLGWSSSGDLVVSYDSIDGGVGVYIFSSPFVESFEIGEALVGGGLRQWNDTRTAFVTFAAIGGGTCNTRFSGYDFTSRQVFPDVAANLGLDPSQVNILPMDSSYTSKNWWNGDSEVLLLITPLQFDQERQDSLLLPTVAGKITLTAAGPEYATVASGPTENFYFTDGVDGFSAQSRPYEARYCND